MAQFSITDTRRAILEKFPDYAVKITPARQRVRVVHGDRTLADTCSALLIQETRHADVYYLPRSDVQMSGFAPTDLSTYCPFKGYASYWRLSPDLENFVWSYEDPYPEVAELKDFLSFYTDQVQIIID